ncbi:MAG: ATP-binding protein [Pseudomonadota bacterium]
MTAKNASAPDGAPQSAPPLDWQAVWNAVPFPALLIGEGDAFAAANPAAEVFFGLSDRSLRKRDVAGMFGEASRVADLVASIRRGAHSLGEHALELALADQPPVLADVHVAILGDGVPGDGIAFILLMIQPQSIAAKMDRTLSHRNAARSVTGMSAMLAHEIKNPLAGISGAAQLLAMQLGDADVELTDLIREEAERIAALLEKVEVFGDDRPPPREPVNIHDILDRAVRVAKAGFADHVRFAEDFDPSLPPTVGDGDQLIQVFLNLLKNAAEATPKIGGQITVRTAFRPGIRMAAPGGSPVSLPLEVSISDNGSGVPETVKRDIFEPFVTSKATGTGLGLALVSKIVTDHGGVVECQSDPGWTTFKVLLPVWKDRPAAALETARQTAKGPEG